MKAKKFLKEKGYDYKTTKITAYRQQGQIVFGDREIDIPKLLNEFEVWLNQHNKGTQPEQNTDKVLSLSDVRAMLPYDISIGQQAYTDALDKGLQHDDKALNNYENGFCAGAKWLKKLIKGNLH